MNKIGELYKGNINNRLFEIIDIKNENGKDYAVVKNVEAKKGEMKQIVIESEIFKRLQLTKVNNEEMV